MALDLYGHPFSAYHQKALIALYERGTQFTLHTLNNDGGQAEREFAQYWPMRHMPLLVDDGRPVMESTIIIEYLERYRGDASPLIPAATDAALEVRFLDRFFDNYVMTPMQRIVFDYIRPLDKRDATTVSEARERLERAYAWLDNHMRGRTWAAGGDFSLADCAAGPSLFYADWVVQIPEQFEHARAYRARLLARPSFARAVDEARPFRSFFPPGAPNRD